MFLFIFFFFTDTSTTEIYTLSLHDALPICAADGHEHVQPGLARGLDDGLQPHAVKQFTHPEGDLLALLEGGGVQDRKSTRLNSSHSQISYAVFCLKKKKKKLKRTLPQHQQR